MIRLIGLISLFFIESFSYAQTTLQPRRIRPVPIPTEAIAFATDTLFIAAADSIESFLLYAWQKDTVHALKGFRIKKQGPTLKDARKQAFMDLVKTAKLALPDSLVKKCEFAPHLGFRIRHKGAPETVFLMALDCDKWRVYGFDTPIQRETDALHEHIIAFAKKLFSTAELEQRHQDEFAYLASLKNPEESIILQMGDSASLPPTWNTRANPQVTKEVQNARTPYEKRPDNKIKDVVSVPRTSATHSQSAKQPQLTQIDYYVLEQDTWETIATFYQVSVKELKTWNAAAAKAPLKAAQPLKVFKKIDIEEK